MNNDIMECYPVEVQEMYNVFSSQTSTDMEIVVLEVTNINTVWVATALIHKLIDGGNQKLKTSQRRI